MEKIDLHKHATLLAVAIFCLSIILAAGCSPTAYAVAGGLSMPCPEGLSIKSENKMVPSLPLPAEMGYRDNVMIANEDGSIVVVLFEVDDPQSLGIGELDSYLGEMVSYPLNKDKTAELDNKLPGMGDMMDNTVIQGPELLDIHGQRALMISRTYRETSREVVCYVEAEGKVVGSIGVISTVPFFESNPDFFDDVLRSVKISSDERN